MFDPIINQTTKQDKISSSNSKYFFDIESYPNLFHVAFRHIETRQPLEVTTFGEDAQIAFKPIRDFICGKTLIGFNSLAYDDLLLLGIINQKNITPKTVHELSNKIIGIKGSQWQKERMFPQWIGLKYMPKKTWQSIDVASCVARDTASDADKTYLSASLKKLGAILRCPSIQTLPYPPETILTEDQAREVITYCGKDLDILERLWESQKSEIELKTYIASQTKLDVINRNRAGLAEEVLISEYSKKTNSTKKQIRQAIPEYRTIPMSTVLDANFDGAQTPIALGVYHQLIQRTINLDTTETEIAVQIAEKVYNFKLGGLHSQDSPGIFRSTKTQTILHADVASYYPSLMQKLQVFPKHLGPVFLEIITAKKERRLQAKAAVKKAIKEGAANIQELQLVDSSLKVQLLSFFGKLGQRGSLLYDPTAMYRVTVNGQLYLIQLIELLEQAGIPVLTANTDGIFMVCDKEKIQTAKDIIKNWQSSLGPYIKMDVDDLDFYARFDANDYIYGAGGKIVRAVGDFEITGDTIRKQEGIPVVAKALQAYVANQIPVKTTVEKSQNPYEFCIIKGTKSQFWLDNKPLLNKVVRCVFSKTAKNQLEAGKSKRIKQDSKLFSNIRTVNEISEFSWDDLDRGRYIAEADRLVSKLEGREPEPTKPKRRSKKSKNDIPGQGDLFENLPEEIELLDAKGLVIVPTTDEGDGKAKPIGWNKRKIDTDFARSWDWDNEEYTGAAVVTGPQSLTVALDIDELEKAQAHLKPFLPLSGMVSGHGVEADKIRNCQACGAMIFRVNEADKLKLVSRDLLKTHGFEIHYQDKSQKVSGTHLETGEEYFTDSDPVIIPKPLLDFLSNLTGHLNPQLAGGIQEKPTKAELLQYEPAQVVEAIKSILPGWKYKSLVERISEASAEIQWAIVRRGQCPFRENHSGNNRDRDFKVYWDAQAENIIVFCAHTSCKPQVAEIFGKLNRKFAELESKKDEQILAEADRAIAQVKTETLGTVIAKSVTEAFELAKKSSAKAVLILSPTGSGKTTAAATEIAKRLRIEAAAKEIAGSLRTDQPIQYVAKLKNDMQQMHDIVEQITTEPERTKLQDISRDHDSKILESTTAMLTHKTYFTRQGISNYHYAPLLWKKPNRTVIIDEIQSYIQSQSIWIAKGGRCFAKHFKNHTIPRKEAIDHCLVTAERGNCSGCTFCPKKHLYSDANGIVSLRTYIEGKTGSDYQPIEIPYVATRNQVQYRTLTVAEIIQGPEVYKNRAYMARRPDDQEAIDFNELFADMLQCAFRPVKYTFNPADRETELPVNWEAIAQEFSEAFVKTESDKELAEAKAAIKAKYLFPNRICGVSLYEFRDRSSLSYLYNHSGKLIMLGATLQQDELEFIQDCCPDVLVIKVKESLYKLDELAVFVYDKNFKYVEKSKKTRTVKTAPISEALGEDGRFLIFEPTKEDAKELFKEYPRGYPRAILSGDSTTIEEGNEDTPYKIGQTWSLGPLGTSISRPKDRGAFVRGQIYLPIIAYGHGTGITKETIINGYKLKATQTAIQNGGRILRGEGRKFVVLHDVDGILPDFEEIKDEWAGMVKTQIKFLHVTESQEYLTETIVEYIQTGNFPIQTEDEYLKKNLAKKAMNEMGTTERKKFKEMSPDEKKEYYQKRKDEKKEKTYQKLLEKGRELKTLGKNWREISPLLNIPRHKDFRDRLKQELGF